MRSSMSQLGAAWDSMCDWINANHSTNTCPFRFPNASQVSSVLKLKNVATSVSSEASAFDVHTSYDLTSVSREALISLQHDCVDSDESHLCSKVLEKLMISCEVHRHALRNRFNKNEKSKNAKRSNLLLLCLIFIDRSIAKQDLRFLNCALKLIELDWLDFPSQDKFEQNGIVCRSWDDVLIVLILAKIEVSLKIVSESNWKTSVNFSSDKKIYPAPDLPMVNVFDSKEAPGVVVFCPNPYSLYTLTVLHLLDAHGINVKSIVVRRLLNHRRFIQEFRRDGTRLLKKVWNKIVLREKAYVQGDYVTFPRLIKDLGILDKSVIAWAKSNNVPVERCNTLNDDNVLQLLKRTNPQVVVFTGGGLIKENILSASGAGIINMHMGILPRYRGMDVVEWPVIEGWSDKVGLSIHFMVKGLDEGDILSMHYALQEHTENLLQLRERMEVLGAKAIVNATVGFLNGDIQPEAQRIEDGKQYFIIHPLLYKIALKKYEAHRNL